MIRVETAVNSMDQLGDNGGNIYPLALNLNNKDGKDKDRYRGAWACMRLRQRFPKASKKKEEAVQEGGIKKT